MKIDTRSQLPQLLDYFSLPKIIAEVGTAEGIFSTEIFNWGIEKLYLIDIWESVPFIEGCASFPQEWHDKNYERVKELFGDKPNVTILKGFSYKMAEKIPDKSLGLAYIDANHEFYGAKADAEIFWNKLMDGGIMAFHDAYNPEYGVWKAVKYFAGEKGKEINMLKEDLDIANMGCWIRK